MSHKKTLRQNRLAILKLRFLVPEERYAVAWDLSPRFLAERQH